MPPEKMKTMSDYLSSYSASRDNNFNLIRFVAASLVLFSHSFALAIGSASAEPLKSTIGMTWGDIAVDVFFVTSGFLITGSHLSSQSVFAFAWARVLRIYPALIAATLFSVFVLGLWLTTAGTMEYLLSSQTYKFLLKNSILIFGIEWALPGVFTDVPWKYAVNGSLWTLPNEIAMYAMLAVVLGVTGGLTRWMKCWSTRNVVLLIAAVSTALHIALYFYPVFDKTFTRLLSMFFTGAAFYFWRDKIRLLPLIALIGFLILMISAMHKNVFFLLYCMLLPYLVFFVAYVPSGGVRNFNKMGDYSYGVYIYAFPVQQSVASLIPGVSVSMMIFVSFAVTLILAVISWHLIEKRFLKMKGTHVHIQGALSRMRKSVQHLGSSRPM
jgi:peptidoglycan/LPS O-acetylase OafA/YrhL